MHPDSPYYIFSREGLGWLPRRHARKQDVMPEDLALLISANPEIIPDPLLRDYVCRGLRGELRRKRGPKWSAYKEGKLVYAAQAINRLTPLIVRRRARLKSSRLFRADGTPQQEAAEIVARKMRLGTGASLLNAISSRRNRR